MNAYFGIFLFFFSFVKKKKKKKNLVKFKKYPPPPPKFFGTFSTNIDYVAKYILQYHIINTPINIDKSILRITFLSPRFSKKRRGYCIDDRRTYVRTCVRM